MPKRGSSSTLVFTGFVLCAVAAIVAILWGILQLVNAMPGLNLNNLIEGILFLVLGLLSLMFSMRVRRRYYATFAILLLIFSILFLMLGLAFGYGGIIAILVGILMLLGVILIMVGRGA